MNILKSVNKLLRWQKQNVPTGLCAHRWSICRTSKHFAINGFQTWFCYQCFTIFARAPSFKKKKARHTLLTYTIKISNSNKPRFAARPPPCSKTQKYHPASPPKNFSPQQPTIMFFHSKGQALHQIWIFVNVATKLHVIFSAIQYIILSRSWGWGYIWLVNSVMTMKLQFYCCL